MKEAQEREVLVREFPVEFAEGDGRTLEARIVPWNTPTRVVDLPEHGGTGIPYEETWLPGAFEKQARAVERVKVWVNVEHEQGLRGIVGHGIALEERSDALYGTFRVHENADGDKALQLVRDGLLGGISLEALPLRSVRKEGVVERVRAHLDSVALCRVPAFNDAQVLAVREAPEPDDDSGEEPAEPVAAPPEPPEDPKHSAADEALRRSGFARLADLEVVRTPWNKSPDRFTDEEYERSCLIVRAGDAPAKERCSLPVLEPSGELNANALDGAWKGIGAQSHVTAELKSAAMRRVIRCYRQAGIEVPAGLRASAMRVR